MVRHIVIEAVTPAVDGGRYPAKRIAGEPCAVEADIFRDGHQVIRAALKWKRAGGHSFCETPMQYWDNDRWRGEFPLDSPGRYVFTIEAWTDQYGSWLADFKKWVEADKSEAASELGHGIALLEKMTGKPEAEEARSQGSQKNASSSLAAFVLDSSASLASSASGFSEPGVLGDVLEGVRAAGSDLRSALRILSDERVLDAVRRIEEREDVIVYAPELEIVADPPIARFGAWYEMFVRSNGTFRAAEQRLHEIHDLGFDVVYLAPIHPIGHTNRKGRNNSIAAGPGDPGSPWAIGSEAGGHTAVEPSLGTLDDFDHFLGTARELGMEIALDFAIQFSPDHPWIKEHPGWFYRRPDGSIRYAENPPMEYKDIHFLTFDVADWQAMWEALRDIVLFWVARGVKIFRVDNPHTKPLVFWQWLIEEVKSRHPDVLFLAEAFTRPKMMKVLSKAGFSQSYTYFLWRNTKAEFEEYMTELAEPGMAEYFRPNFFANTPDNLSEVLQKGGRPAFKMRLVLAATLSPSYGIYSGYEICENQAFEGTEESRDSEKYEIKVRGWNQPGNLNEFIARVNRIRRENHAFSELGNIRFFETDNEQIMVYGKRSGDNAMIVAVNMDPYHAHHCMVRVLPEAIGVKPGESYEVFDLLTGARYTWAENNYVRLDPQVEPAHVLRVERR